MKIGAFVPQGWRMDLNGIPIEDQWNRLPRSIKTPLRQASANPFLPGYENLLEQFYLKLNRR